MTAQAPAQTSPAPSTHNPIDAAQTFGVEIETTGLTRLKTALALCGALQVESMAALTIDTDTYNTHRVKDAQGRVWKVMADGSIQTDGGQACEVVTPPLTWADMPILQEVIRALRKAGAKVNASCGVHIHIGVAGWTPAQLVNLCGLFNRQEDLIYHALKVQATRVQRWCKKNDAAFIKRCARVRTMTDLKKAWYGDSHNHPIHYDPSRYRGLNLHNIWYRPQSPTVEYRLFEATLHAGEIKAMVALVLSMANRAKNQSRIVAKHKPFDPACAKYDMRVFMIKLGLIGPEYANIREHLIKHCQGDASYKRGKPAPAAPQTAPQAPQTEGV